MKKLSTIALLAVAVALCGCESLGLSKVKMDNPKSVQRVSETLKKHIDAAEYKPVSVMWYEREELSNSMEYMFVDMAGRDGEKYTQSFKVGGDYQGPGEVEESLGSGSYDFAVMKYLTPADIDPATVIGWIDAAKSDIPEEYKVESVGKFTMSIDPETGEKSSEFTLRITEKGNKRGVQSGTLVTTYYEVEFYVTPAGDVLMLIDDED